MTRWQRNALIGSLVLAAALLMAGVFSQLQSYPKEITHGPAPEAQNNPYLAAEQFLRQRGVAVEHSEHLNPATALPSHEHTLIWLADRNSMTPREAERLLQWAANGGHLVLIAERIWDEKTAKSGDLLLDLLGIEQHLSAELEGETDEAEPEHAAHPELTQLYVENEQAPAYLALSVDFHLYDAQDRAHAWANSAAATHLLQLYHGDGLVTVLSDPWIWRNDAIAQYDHAWLLWYLTQDTAVTLVSRSQQHKLFSQVLQHFPLTLLVLALAITALLWHYGMRYGPQLPAASRSRRQLQEHLHASADFLVRHSGQASLLKALQHDIKRRARRLHPGFERLDLAQQWQIIRRLSRMPAKDISQAMRPPTAARLSARDFTRQVAHLQTLRNAL